MNDVRTKRCIFSTTHIIDYLGVPGSNQVNASGVRVDFQLLSGYTPLVDAIDIRNVAVTSYVPTTLKINFFSEEKRGGTSWTDSTYVGGVQISTASGVPECEYSGIGVYYGNAFNSTYGNGPSCYLPYFARPVAAVNPRDVNDGYKIYATVQNLGSVPASKIKVVILYEIADPKIE